MELDRGGDGDGGARSKQSPGDREMPSVEESEDRMDDGRSAQKGCARCTADGLEVYHR
jgi:hypothetical protein